MPKPRISKRLARLVKLGICPTEDASKYANELMKLADDIADSEASDEQSKFFKALADETRLRIVKLLGVREMCVCEVMVALRLTQPTTSHHLGILEKAGLVSDRKEGKWGFYSLSNPNLIESMRKLNIL